MFLKTASAGGCGRGLAAIKGNSSCPTAVLVVALPPNPRSITRQTFPSLNIKGVLWLPRIIPTPPPPACCFPPCLISTISATLKSGRILTAHSTEAPPSHLPSSPSPPPEISDLKVPFPAPPHGAQASFPWALLRALRRLQLHSRFHHHLQPGGVASGTSYSKPTL